MGRKHKLLYTINVKGDKRHLSVTHLCAPVCQYGGSANTLWSVLKTMYPLQELQEGGIRASPPLADMWFAEQGMMGGFANRTPAILNGVVSLVIVVGILCHADHT